MSGAHRAPEVAGDSRVHRLDPRAKIAGLLAITLIAVSAPVDAWPTYVACALVLAAVAAAARVPPRAIARRARIVLPLVLLAGVLVPFVRTGGATSDLGPFTVHEAGLRTFAQLAAKATIGTVAAVLLAATTTAPDLLRGFDALKAPRTLVLIAALMHRYLFVLGDEAARMRTALAARGYRPRHALKAAPAGHVAGALFLRAHARGERVHRAMLARGFSGGLPRESRALGAADVAFAATIAAVLLAVRIAA
ncbi:cobalt ECF transporter T component CbiQ [Candidatus Solirubrobacter pratensis]|uniref:cobalt ECF transporter T component CbiQ n=1 Tax=Candidatus Solirubrobacter pratensis TaxID=1298857 RepID=UPI00041E33C4|nr:cobalt ECF transporter T component CbiQ [Candidatus Solirubrobacter pratensis]